MINVQPNSCELVPLSQSRLHEEKNCKINPWNDQSASVEKTYRSIYELKRCNFPCQIHVQIH